MLGNKTKFIMFSKTFSSRFSITFAIIYYKTFGNSPHIKFFMNSNNRFRRTNFQTISFTERSIGFSFSINSRINFIYIMQESNIISRR